MPPSVVRVPIPAATSAGRPCEHPRPKIRISSRCFKRHLFLISAAPSYLRHLLLMAGSAASRRTSSLYEHPSSSPFSHSPTSFDPDGDLHLSTHRSVLELPPLPPPFNFSFRETRFPIFHLVLITLHLSLFQSPWSHLPTSSHLTRSLNLASSSHALHPLKCSPQPLQNAHPCKMIFPNPDLVFGALWWPRTHL